MATKTAAEPQVLEDDLVDTGDVQAEISFSQQQAAELAAEAQQKVQEIGRKHKDIWTLRSMHKREPAPADLYGDGKFIFLFQPENVYDSYSQERYLLAEKVQDKEEGKPGDYVRMQLGYAEIVAHCVVDWPLRETVQDKDGNDKVDEDGELITVPWPPTLEHVKRFTLSELTDFLNAMSNTLAGEVKGQRS